MNVAAISLGALLVAILVSCVSRLNVGLLAIVMAWVVGVFLGDMKPDEVAAGFPVQLFLTLAGVTILFTQAQENGTLERLALRAIRLCHGNAGTIPMVFFLIGTALASVGPGNIATAALIAPMAMAVAGRARIPAFLMAIMAGNGANAGALSPLAPTGIIVAGLLKRIGLEGIEGQAYAANFAAHAVVAFGGYCLLGGLKLFGHRHSPDAEDAPPKLDRGHWTTILVIAALLLSVVFLKINVGFGAFAAVVVLALTRAADPEKAMAKAPWGVMLMVGGVSVLVSLLEKTGGLDLFAGLLARLANRESATAIIAFVTGIVSAFSSTSSVVLPAFLPTVPGLAERLGADAKSIALSMCVASHLVDVSPLSTIGAICIASAAPGVDKRVLFNQLLAWGMAMTVVGAGLCYLLFGL